MGKENLKLYPLNRFVIERDGNGQVIEIVTRERINKKLIEKYLPKDYEDESVVEEVTSVGFPLITPVDELSDKPPPTVPLYVIA